MDRTTFAALIAIISIMVSGTAFSQSSLQPSYSSEQFVAFMIKSANMGVARGICVGTVEECKTKVEKPTGFDMLVTFELNSSELTEQARANLEQIAIALKDPRLAAATFLVEGHTDATGPEAYNLTLSKRRAEAVRNFLLERGLAAKRITAIGLGESSPRAADAFDPSNRRVEIRIKLQ